MIHPLMPREWLEKLCSHIYNLIKQSARFAYDDESKRITTTNGRPDRARRRRLLVDGLRFVEIRGLNAMAMIGYEQL